MAIRLETGDITAFQADAIVNAANSRLAHGGGVAAAISRAAGPELQRESDELVRREGPVPVGGAVATGGHDLPARWVIHAVGPRYGQEGGREAELLASAYRSSLAVALEIGASGVAFPAISTGIFGYPLGEAARIAVETVRRHAGGLKVTFVLFDRRTLDVFEAFV